MNSLILSLVSEFGHKIARVFKSSALYGAIDRCHAWFSGGWSESRIMTFLRNEKCEKSESLIFRFIYSPFTFLEFLNRKIGEWVDNKIKESVLVGLARGFIDNFLALNTRFLGMILLAWGITNAIIRTGFSVWLVITEIVGILLIFINCNVTEFLKSSKIISFITNAGGFGEISFKIYNNEYINKTSVLIIGAIFGIIAGILPLKIAVLLPVVVTAVGAVLIYPVVGVFFAVAIAPVVPTMVLAGVCALSFASLVIHSLRKKDFIWRRDSLGGILGLFLFFMLVSCLFSFSAKKSLMVVGMYLIFVGFYFVIVNTVKTKKQLYSLLRVFAIIGAAVALYGVMQYVFGWNTNNAWIDEEMFEEATMRVYSTMENPNVLGEYLLLVIPLAAMFVLKKGGKPIEKIMYTGIFLLSLLCMVLTQSRGCWLGLLLSVAFFITFYNGRLWALLPIAILILPFIMPEAFLNRMMSVGNMEDSSTSYRVFIWRGTARMLRDFWLGGIGMGEGAFRSVYPLYSYNAIIAPHSHNTFLQLVVEGGIFALAIFIGAIVTFLKNMNILYRKSEKGSEDSLVVLAVSGGVLGFMLQSMFDYTFYNYRMMAMFFMILALGMTLKSLKEEKNA